MIRSLPIRLRLTSAFAVAMAILLIATSAFIYERVRFALDRSIRTELAAGMRRLTPTIDRANFATDNVPDIGSIATYAQIYDTHGSVLYSTQRIQGHRILTRAQARQAAHATINVNTGSLLPRDSASFRVRARRMTSAGDVVVSAIAVRRDHRDEALHELLAQLLAANTLALALASLIGYRVTGAAFDPVEQMRVKAADITAGASGSLRLPVPAADDELRLLALTLNEMIDRLQQALESQRRFVGDASHELRTPLTIMKAEAEVLLRRPRTREELEVGVQGFLEEANRLIALSEQLLLIAAGDSEAIALHLVQVDLTPLLERVANRFRATAQAANRTIVVNAEEETACLADEAHLEQAASNLIANAIAHGDGDITVLARHELAGITVHVIDQGQGMPPEFIDSAFERFSRPDHGRSGGGTGLGLSIVQSIATAHGGSIGAANLHPRGLDVWITIPSSG